MLRIPLPEDDRFALRLSSLCVSVPSASSEDMRKMRRYAKGAKEAQAHAVGAR